MFKEFSDPHSVLSECPAKAKAVSTSIRKHPKTSLGHRKAIYIILLTTRNGKEDVIAGLEGGADDYVISH